MSIVNGVYEYFGLKFGRMNVKVVLVSAEFQNKTDGSHVAVWAGVNGPGNRMWVQGGVLTLNFEEIPQVYIETGHEGKQTSIETWAIAYGVPVTLKLRRKRGIWQLTVKWGDQTRVSKKVHIDRPTVDTLLEIMGKAKAVCKINGRTVRGNTMS